MHFILIINWENQWYLAKIVYTVFYVVTNVKFQLPYLAYIVFVLYLVTLLRDAYCAMSTTTSNPAQVW